MPMSRRYSRIGVVLGASRGIGLAIARQIALQYAASPLNDGPLLLYITSRYNNSIGQAMITLISDPELMAANCLFVQGGLVTLTIHVVDVTNDISVNNFVTTLMQLFDRSIDFVVNNAGVLTAACDPTTVKMAVETNYYGTLRSCTALQATMNPQTGRIITTVHALAAVQHLTLSLAHALAATRDINELGGLMAAFMYASDSNPTRLAAGLDPEWPPNPHAVTKAAVVELMRMFNDQNRMMGSGVTCLAVQPGLLPGQVSHGIGGGYTFDDMAQMLVWWALNGHINQTLG